jgi:hypothetical protein
VDLKLESKDYDESDDVDDGIRMLMARLPSDDSVWATLTNLYAADVFCGLFLTSLNRGFGLSVEVSRLLSDRNLEVGFDEYFDLPNQVFE